MANGTTTSSGTLRISRQTWHTQCSTRYPSGYQLNRHVTVQPDSVRSVHANCAPCTVTVWQSMNGPVPGYPVPVPGYPGTRVPRAPYTVPSGTVATLQPSVAFPGSHGTRVPVPGYRYPGYTIHPGWGALPVAQLQAGTQVLGSTRLLVLLRVGLARSRYH
eukprot:2798057-Rhodomonas_salina.2